MKISGSIERESAPARWCAGGGAPFRPGLSICPGSLHRLAELGFAGADGHRDDYPEVPILFKKVLSAEDIGEIIEYSRTLPGNLT